MHYLVSVPVNENVASFIGKKSSEEGLVFFNRKLDDNTIVAIMPANREDKVYYSMAESMLMCGQIVVSTENVDKLLGEVLVASSLLGKHVIVMDENDVSSMVKGLLKDFEVSSRDELLSKIVARKEANDGDLRIDVDMAFQVKGIGTVVLGIVTRGKVRVHDVLYHSSGRQATVKSIQSQDVDVQEAGYGTRVGLALKGIESDEIEKGDLLLPKPYAKSKSAKISFVLSPFSKEKLEPGNRYLFVSNFSHAICKVEGLEGSAAMLSFEKPLAVITGDKFMLIREESPRIFGSGTVTESA